MTDRDSATQRPPSRAGAAFLTAVGLFLTVLAVAAVAADEPPSPTTSQTRGGHPASATANATDDNRSRNDRGQGPDRDDGRDARPGEPRKPARLQMENGTGEGRYVAFQIDETNCVVRDYRVYNVTFFDAIQLSGSPCRIAKGGFQAGQVEFGSADATLRIHDAPNGLLRFDAGQNASIAFHISPTILVNETSRGLALSVGNLSGHLFRTDADEHQKPGGASSGALNRSGTEGTASNTDGDFLVHPASGSSPERRAVLDAIQNGKVGAEVDLLATQEGVVSEPLVYDDVDVNVHQGKGPKFEVTVGANLTGGRAFVANLGPGVVESGRVRIDYFDFEGDGSSAGVRIRPADDAADALEASPGEGPEYWVFSDEDGVHALVTVPEFSVHMFVVVGLPLQVVPLILYGIVLGGLFFAAGGLGLYLERRGKRSA